VNAGPVRIRCDYFDSPGMPRPRVIVPGASAIVRQRSAILMVRRQDNGMWSLPGGAIEVGESIPETAVREVREETGIDIEIAGLVGVYSSPRHVTSFSTGADIRQEFNLCFRGRRVGGGVQRGDECLDVRWVPTRELEQVPMLPSTRLKLAHFRQRSRLPYIG
jgi:8-oxo-dGTP pyrophosphatase MutT (NUDIX family)